MSNVRLRPLRTDDFKIYYQLVSNAKIAELAQFRPASNVQAARKLFNDDLHKVTSYAVTRDDAMIGMLSLYATIGNGGAPDHSCLELAYMILPDFQGHGYMTRALKQLIDRLRRGSSVKRLVALVNTQNRASREVLLKNRFNNYNSVMDMNSGGEDLIYQLNL